MTRSRILIAEDQPEVADQLEQLLGTAFDVVGVVADGRALVDAARAMSPDLVVTDIAMPQLNGLDAAIELMSACPGVRVVYVSVHDEPSLVHRAMATGICGYVLKSEAGEDLVPAIHAVLRGEPFLSAVLREAGPDAAH